MPRCPFSVDLPLEFPMKRECQRNPHERQDNYTVSFMDDQSTG
jgi:hypothetical protein